MRSLLVTRCICVSFRIPAAKIGAKVPCRHFFVKKNLYSCFFHLSSPNLRSSLYSPFPFFTLPASSLRWCQNLGRILNARSAYATWIYYVHVHVCLCGLSIRRPGPCNSVFLWFYIVRWIGEYSISYAQPWTTCNLSCRLIRLPPSPFSVTKYVFA